MDEKFFASAKYDDFKGTAAADMADNTGPTRWLRQQGKMDDGEFIAGITVWTGENHGEYLDPIAVEFLIVRGTQDSVQSEIRSGDPLKTRSYTVDIPIAEFLGLFKRFSISLSPHGILEGRAFQRTDVGRT